MVSSGASLTSWGECASLALVGHPSNDVVAIKIPYGIDVLHQPAWHPFFPIELVINEPGFLLLGRLRLA